MVIGSYTRSVILEVYRVYGYWCDTALAIFKSVGKIPPDLRADGERIRVAYLKKNPEAAAWQTPQTCMEWAEVARR